MDQADDRFVERYARADKDREDDAEPGPSFASTAAEEKSDTEWNRGESIAEVMNEIREQRDRVRQNENGNLSSRRERKDPQTQRNRTYSGTRADDGWVDETVRMALVVSVVVVVTVGMGSACDRARSTRRE